MKAIQVYTVCYFCNRSYVNIKNHKVCQGFRSKQWVSGAIGLG